MYLIDMLLVCLTSKVCVERFCITETLHNGTHVTRIACGEITDWITG